MRQGPNQYVQHGPLTIAAHCSRSVSKSGWAYRKATLLRTFHACMQTNSLYGEAEARLCPRGSIVGDRQTYNTCKATYLR